MMGMVSERKAIRLVSLVTHQLMELVGEGKLTAQDASRVFDHIATDGFMPAHPEFAEGLKKLATQVSMSVPTRLTDAETIENLSYHIAEIAGTFGEYTDLPTDSLKSRMAAAIGRAEQAVDRCGGTGNG